MYKIFIYFKDGTMPVRGCPHLHKTLKEANKEYMRYKCQSYDVELRNRNDKTLRWTNINWAKAGRNS